MHLVCPWAELSVVIARIVMSSRLRAPGEEIYPSFFLLAADLKVCRLVRQGEKPPIIRVERNKWLANKWITSKENPMIMNGSRQYLSLALLFFALPLMTGSLTGAP